MKVPNNSLIKLYTGRLKIRQRGMTLIEVLIAMFVLAIGVLALLSTQLRTVASVHEAESQTIVAQAVQNLMESMLINPTLCSKDNLGDSRCTGKVNDQTPEGWVVKSYDNNKIFVEGNAGAISYRFSNPIKVRSCRQSRWCQPDSVPSLNKRQILEDHLGRFESALSEALPNANIWYIICNDNSGREMTISNNAATPSHLCSRNDNHPLVVKVLWEMEAEKVESNQALKSNGKKIVYTYQARLAE
ncbi:type IV pilus modification protein PilV [Neisseria sp. Dent CA1/247]|uniref:type IV pilus modification protein PilV n=1 Tax=Neisseria sp. Dent CA1/247 TaxID=2912675 RepID=UPI001FCF82B5|nr:type IV pilus modification protein PilV [Neisseria sp. Dent CA1/247]UOO76331.1 type IV pilus modification protein PilV [Neisseria sp. Dent CA1/247]